MPTKTTVKKSAPKAAKRSPKKSTSKTAARKSTAAPKVLVCANHDQCFWTTDGQILQDLRQLEAALAQMQKEVFSYHVTPDKNDFAQWIADVLQDAECAAALRKVKTPKSAHTIVLRHLKLYQL